MMAKREALKIGNATARALKWLPTVSKNWKVVVWNNFGWHCKVVNGFWKVHPNVRARQLRNGKWVHEVKSYTAFLGPDATGGKWAESGASPKSAITATRTKAKEDLKEIERLLEG